MALPEKNYFALAELAKRWSVELGDVKYYAEHGFLEVQAWLAECIVEVLTMRGDKVLGQLGLQVYKGYAILEPDKVRQVFHGGRKAADRFTALDRSSQYHVLGETEHKVEVADWW